MAHPYFVKATVFNDIPKLDDERDNDFVVEKGEQADDEIDNLLPSPLITVPLDTVPDIIKIASTKRTEGIIYVIWGEKLRGEALIESSNVDVANYIKTFRQNTADRTGVVSIIDDTYKDFENSPLVDDYFP